MEETDVAEEQNATEQDIDEHNITLLATNTIIIHPGSSLLRIGRASDPQPAQVPHVIAWRHTEIIFSSEDYCLLERNPDDYVINSRIQHQKQGLEDAYNDVQSICGRKMITKNKIAKVNKDNSAQVFSEDCGWWWTDTSGKPKCLIGDDALYADKNDCYELHWPIAKGRLNIHGKVHGSISVVLSDIEHLWKKAIESFLKISPQDLRKYKCVLLIPDIFDRSHIKSLVHLLFDNIGFSDVMLHQESVSALYGCGIATGCVVDVGHHKTAICCIEDGISHPETRITIDYGGRDIGAVFAWLLKQNSFPYRSCNVANRMDAMLLDELKETFCHMDLGKDIPENQEFHIRRPGQKSLLYPIMLGYETLQAPLSLFYPRMLGIKMDSSHIHLMADNVGDSEDVFDELFLNLCKNKAEELKLLDLKLKQREFEGDVGTISGFHNDSMETEENRPQSSAPDNLMSMDEAIVWSIENCPPSYEDELKRRMYNSIVLVGGGIANFKGVDSFITRKIQNIIPASIYQKQMMEQVNVLVKTKDQDPALIAWKGGSILPCLDNAQEIWVSSTEWKQHGVKLLRERSPFIW